MRRLKTIDELYDEVKGYGLVITNDIALETALNSRIDYPCIGNLAITPRHIAKQLGSAVLGKAMLSDLELIAKVSEETGIGFKHVYSEIMNFREIRKHTLEVASHVTSRNSRKVFRSYDAMPTLERAMSMFDPNDPLVSWFFEKKGGVAVIGVELFNDLDKHFIPDDCEFIDIHTDEEFTIDTIYETGNDRQLAENAVSLIDPEHATDYAIVLSASSPIADAVRASLYRRDLPFVNSLDFRDLSQIRDYLSFLSLSLNYNTLRVKDVKELYANYNGFFKGKQERYLLNRISEEDMKNHASVLRETMRGICEDGLTFGQVRDVIDNKRSRIQVTTLLRELGMEDSIVTPARMSDLRFAVDNVQELRHNEEIPESEKHGVLIADCKNSVFVDRPIVIFLGMEQEWYVPVVGRRYLDSEAEAELNANRLGALIQQGQRRVYLVNNSKRGKEVRPCLTFDTVFGKLCNGFSDMCDNLIPGKWTSPTEEIVRLKGDMDIDQGKEFEEPFSKTTFNNYVCCPRRYMFSRLLGTSEATYTEFGNLVHEFAELYACYPDVVNEKGMDFFIDMVSERYSGLSSPLMGELDTDKITIALNNIRRFMDRRGIRLTPDSINSRRRYPNSFMQELGLEKTSDQCESDRTLITHPAHGKFDLYWNGEVYDYKTGKASEPKDIRKNMNLNEINDFSEFQPLIYLALACEIEGTRKGFNLFYALEGGADSASEDYDLNTNIRHISIVPGNVIEFAKGSIDVRTEFKRIASKEMKEYTDIIIDCLDEANSNMDPTEWVNDESYIERIYANIGKRIDRKKLNPAINKLAGIVGNGIALVERDLYVTEEALERFLLSVDEIHTKAMSEIHNQMPAKPNGKVDCRKCDFFEACTGDKVLIDMGGEIDG